ncbi:MAG: hypothetical protein DRI46_08805 [Chloroflexi bacterium]|nr:MAG: hypothetical protein DRI46_08805 [Chloroflexota bacterium]
MIKYLQLIVSLIKDQRIHPLIKILPFLSLIYLLYPDFIPGPFDDAVVIALFLKIFLALVPDEYIEEHRFNRDYQQPGSSSEEEIIEGEFWEE